MNYTPQQIVSLVNLSDAAEKASVAAKGSQAFAQSTAAKAAHIAENAASQIPLVFSGRHLQPAKDAYLRGIGGLVDFATAAPKGIEALASAGPKALAALTQSTPLALSNFAKNVPAAADDLALVGPQSVLAIADVFPKIPEGITQAASVIPAALRLPPLDFKLPRKLQSIPNFEIPNLNLPNLNFPNFELPALPGYNFYRAARNLEDGTEPQTIVQAQPAAVAHSPSNPNPLQVVGIVPETLTKGFKQLTGVGVKTPLSDISPESIVKSLSPQNLVNRLPIAQAIGNPQKLIGTAGSQVVNGLISSGQLVGNPQKLVSQFGPQSVIENFVSVPGQIQKYAHAAGKQTGKIAAAGPQGFFEAVTGQDFS